MGPWQLGRWYRPLAVVCVVYCVLLIAIGMAPPNDQAAWMVGGTLLLMFAAWWGVERKRFRGPPAVAPAERPA